MKTEHGFIHKKHGTIETTEKDNTRVMITLDDDVLEWFREKVEAQGGGNYQTMINQLLRSHIKPERPIADQVRDVMREVLREELRLEA